MAADASAGTAPAAASIARLGCVAVYVKQKGGCVQIYPDVSSTDVVGNFSKRLAERDLNAGCHLYLITDFGLWNLFKADPAAEDAFLSGTPQPAPLDKECPVKDNMRLLAVPPPPGPYAIPGFGRPLPTIPESAVLRKLDELEAKIEACMEKLEARFSRALNVRRQKMSAVSSKALHASLRVNGVWRQLCRVPASLAPVPIRQFDWGNPPMDEEASAARLNALAEKMIGSDGALADDVHLENVRGVDLQYSFDSLESDSGTRYDVYGMCDTAVVINEACDDSPRDAMASAIMLVNWKTPTALAASMPRAGPAGARACAAEAAGAAKSNGDIISREMVLQMLAFHAWTGRWVPVVATDLATHLRVFRKQGGFILEYRAGESFALLPLGVAAGERIARVSCMGS